jgi:hypothetical protein
MRTMRSHRSFAFLCLAVVVFASLRPTVASDLVDAMESRIDEAALATLEQMCAGGGVDLERLGIRGPSTWTYLVNDDPFRDQIGMLLTGPGRTSVAIYAAAVMMPLLLVWGLLDRLLRRRPKRRGIP